MNKKKKKVAVIVGSGFSYAFTEGKNRVIGNKTVPTLHDLARTVHRHMMKDWEKSPYKEKVQLIFPPEIIESTTERLGRFIKNKDDFEQIMSLFSLRGSFEDYHYACSQTKSEFECLSYALASCFAACLFKTSSISSSCENKVYYQINNDTCFEAFRGHYLSKDKRKNLSKLVDKHDVVFIDFNYDGILELLLEPISWSFVDRMDTPEGRQQRILNENLKSTGNTEHIYGIPTRTVPEKMNKLLLLKPHGSIHFFKVSEEVSRLSGFPSIMVQDFSLISYNDSEIENNPVLACIENASPIPFIVPPVFNKDSYLPSADYSKIIMRKILTVLLEADSIISIGFSIPNSDVHIRALFDIVNQHNQKKQKEQKKRIGLIYRKGKKDKTSANWKQVFTSYDIRTICEKGLAVSSEESIDEMWKGIFHLCN